MISRRAGSNRWLDPYDEAFIDVLDRFLLCLGKFFDCDVVVVSSSCSDG
jgi:hypothetical protein